MTLHQYIDNINIRYLLGNATEHTFRGDLEQLLECLVPDIRVANGPKRQGCRVPDGVLTQKDISVGFIEAKDLQNVDQLDNTTPNLNTVEMAKIAEKISLPFISDHENIPEEFLILVDAKLLGEPFERPYDYGYKDCFTPLDVLDYIYAVLHSPSYREKYKEFLKIDFPRVPYPKDAATFWQLVNLGSQIREIHLFESPIVEELITQYPMDGNNVVTKPQFVNAPPVEGAGEVGKVYINDTQYFNNVPLTAWEFYIGGYQPAQKWLKDRKDRTLTLEDILHYQKIIVALTETDRLMKEIDTIEME